MIRLLHFKTNVLTRRAMREIVVKNQFNSHQDAGIRDCPIPDSILENYDIESLEISQDGCDKPKEQSVLLIYDGSKSIDVWLRVYRTNHKLSQLELSKIIGVRRATLADWERGVSFPNSVNLEKICMTLGLTLRDILIRSQHSLSKSDL